MYVTFYFLQIQQWKLFWSFLEMCDSSYYLYTLTLISDYDTDILIYLFAYMAVSMNLFICVSSVYHLFTCLPSISGWVLVSNIFPLFQGLYLKSAP